MSIELGITSNFKNHLKAKKRFVISQGGARCHPEGTLIRMYDGTLKDIKYIVEGDKVANYTGTGYNTVQSIHNGYGDIFKIEQGRAMNYETNGEHLLVFKQTQPFFTRKTLPDGRRKEINIPYDKDKLHYFSAREWAELGEKKRRHYSGIRNTYLELPEVELRVPAYFMGLWLGDGSSARTCEISTGDSEVVDYMRTLTTVNDYLYKVSDCTYRIRSHSIGGQTELSKRMSSYGIRDNKHIPKDFIYNSYQNRLQLIAGLVDSDGSYTGRNTLEITQKREDLMIQIREVLLMSGFYTNGIRSKISKMKRDDGSVYECKTYSIEFNHPDFKDLNEYIRIPRKRVVKNLEGSKFNMTTSNVTATYDRQDNYYGFTLDGDNLYKLEDGTVTHNSGKTFSILQIFVMMAKHNANRGLIFSVVSETMPHLKKGAIRDFTTILTSSGLWDRSKWNKTESTYDLFGNTIEFFSVDDAGKARGPARDFLFINECNNVAFETAFQLIGRTNYRVYLDFNPVFEFWVHTEIMNNPSYKGRWDYIESTFLDNELLNENIKKDMLARAERDENYRRVYVEGKVGKIEGVIYNNWTIISSIPENVKEACQKQWFGLDWGWNDATSLNSIWILGTREQPVQKIYIDELVYQSSTRNKDVAQVIKNNIERANYMVIADSSEPKSIDEVELLGINITGAEKPPGSINFGIEVLQQAEIYVTARSVNTIKELRNYKWATDRNGKTIRDSKGRPVPIDNWNHSLDEIRYVAYTANNEKFEYTPVIPNKSGRRRAA